MFVLKNEKVRIVEILQLEVILHHFCVYVLIYCVSQKMCMPKCLTIRYLKCCFLLTIFV